MIAIFKREIKAYFSSVIGWIFLAVSIGAASFFVLFTNLVNAVPQIEYGIMGSLIATLATIPFLTCVTYAQENESKNIKFLLSLPVSTLSIVLGKYLASLAVFAIPVIFMAIVPVILTLFGGVILVSSYSSIFTFLIFGAALVALCSYIGSRTKNSVLSCIYDMLILAVVFAAPYLAVYIPTTPVASLIGVLALGLCLSLLVWLLSKNAFASAVSLGVSWIATALGFMISKNSFCVLFERIVRFISPFERFKNSTQGIFDIGDVIYLSVFAAFFIFLTHRSVEAKRCGPAPIKSRATFSTAVAAVLFIAISLSVLAFPAGSLMLDASGLGMHSISDRSKEFASKIDEDVTIYLLCDGGIPDRQTEAVLAEYAAQSKHINYKRINITANPEFTVKYFGIAYTGENDDGARPLNNNSVIIESAKRATVIDSSRFYHYRVGNQSYSESEFLYYCEQAVQSGYSVSDINYNTYFDIDKVIASGLEYVTLNDVNTVFTLTGHGEKKLSPKFYDNLTYSSVIYDDINLSEWNDIPEHCVSIIIAAPETDISESDAQKIIKYLNRGGDVILVTSPENTEMANLLSVTKAYGLTAEVGTIQDPNAENHKDGIESDLILEINTGHNVVSFIKSQYSGTNVESQPRFPNAHSIIKTGTADESITITEMLATSDEAVLTVDNNVISAESKTYFTGYGVEKDINGDDSEIAHLFWYSSYDAFKDEYTSSNPINIIYLLVSLSYMGGADDFETSIIIDSVNISGSFLDVDQSIQVIWCIVMGLITLILLGAAVAIAVINRSKKVKHLR